MVRRFSCQNKFAYTSIMVRRTKPSTRRPRRPARKQRRGQLMNSEIASAKETLKLAADDMGTIYNLYDTNLSNFDRLAAIARAYQFYRFTKIEVKFIPHADTFTQGAGTSVPTLYTMIDRNENVLFSASGFDQLREMGVKPIRFDDKIVVRSWRPSVLQTMPQDNANPPTSVGFQSSRLSPWLPTNYFAAQEVAPWQWSASTVPHRGIIYGVYQIAPGPSAYQYHIEVTVHAQFKKPNVVYKPPTDAEPFVPAVDKVLKV